MGGSLTERAFELLYVGYITLASEAALFLSDSAVNAISKLIFLCVEENDRIGSILPNAVSGFHVDE
jgi:hypothetical protein